MAAAVEEKVKQIIVEQLGVDEGEVTPNASFVDDLGADSLDTVELVMAFEEALSNLPPGDKRDRLIREIEERIARGEFGDEDDDALASLVRIIGPRKPHGQAGAAAIPE